MLSWHAEAEVRQLALKRVRAARLEEREIRLLRKTYQVGDRRLVRGALEKVPAMEPDTRHSIVSDLLDVLRANLHPENGRLLLFAYEHTPCTYCRREAVTMMRELDVLPKWVRRECAFDADAEIRRGGRHLMENSARWISR